MSNPGVFTLTQKSIGANKPFKVEDNLGESIHLHYNDIRIDLTIKELLYLSKICDKAIYELIDVPSFHLDDFESNFLNQYSQYLIDLKLVSEDYMNPKEFYYQTINLIHLPIRRKLTFSRAKRILSTNNSVCLNSTKEPYAIVLFNNDNTILYGEKIAASHLLQHPELPIKVLRMHFENNKYSIYKFPWIPFLFKWDRQRLIHVAKKIAMKVLQ